MMEHKDGTPLVSLADERSTGEDLPRLLLDNLDSGLLAIGKEGEILYLNQLAQEVLDVELKGVRGRPLQDVVRSEDDDWLNPIPEDRLGDPRRHRETSLKVGEKEVVIESVAQNLTDRRGRLLGVLISFQDISDIAEDEEFRRTAERLAHLGELSAVVAHEIRNPLTGIRTTIQFLASKLASGDPMQSSLADVISELDRVETIITDLLVLARPQRGTRSLVDINTLIDKCLDSVSSQLDDSSVTVKKDLADDLPRVEVDDSMVQQVFLNMLVNAIDAMDDSDEPTLRVSSALRRYRVKRPTVEVSFSDTGCGIPTDARDRIFDPFFTTKTMGTGLGLPLSLQIMKDHGGAIHVRNRPQRGTIFKLQFPVPEEQEIS